MENKRKVEDNVVSARLEGIEKILAEGNSIFLRINKPKEAFDKEKKDIELFKLMERDSYQSKTPMKRVMDRQSLR